MEFHVTNTFLQTFIIVMASYLTFYFDMGNFTDRIMVTVTTMLVIATITGSIQEVNMKFDFHFLLLSLKFILLFTESA